ncbi:MAG TPA: thioesterase [Bacteroidales bacterium]|nr:MAG: thioesterase [Bacteroidetes bacterium GWF2_33_38]HBF89151.1 thioesterase [Bacteroidales bacterium]
MISNKTEIRITYADTDKMGYCYYGNYPRFYEIGRTELMRKLGLSYKELEESGIMMPVLSLNIKYIKPAFYDDIIVVETFIKEIPTSRIVFEYEVRNQYSDLINKGETVLAFVDDKSRKVVRVPDILFDKISKHL